MYQMQFVDRFIKYLMITMMMMIHITLEFSQNTIFYPCELWYRVGSNAALREQRTMHIYRPGERYTFSYLVVLALRCKGNIGAAW